MEEQEDKRAYLDSWFVVEVVKAKMGEKNQEIDVSKIYYDIEKYWYPYVPQPAVGEVVNSLLGWKDLSSEELISALTKLYDLLTEVKMKPLSWDVVEIATELRKLDDRLTPTDAVIAGMALADDRCTWLVTIDNVMIRSSAITQMTKKLVDEGRREHALKVGLNH